MLDTKTLAERQERLRAKQTKARNRQQSKNASGSRKKPTRFRPRSLETSLLEIAGSPEVAAKWRLQAARFYCLLTNRPVLPESLEKDKEDEGPQPLIAEVFRGADLKLPDLPETVQNREAVSVVGN